MSELNSVVSEYTNMVLLETQRGKANADNKKVNIFSLHFERKQSMLKKKTFTESCSPLPVVEFIVNYLVLRIS